MKKRLQGLIAGVLICAILSTGMVFAKQISETAELFYHDIKIFIDGAEVVPKDANGNVVEPFIMNGTTYLPVRAVANAFEKDVEWDGIDKSVYIGKKDFTRPDHYLDRIQYTDFKYRDDDNKFYKINGTITDYLNQSYTNGILLYKDSSSTIENDSDNASILIDYPLNSQYTTLLGKIVLPRDVNIAGLDERKNIGNDPVDVLFIGDGELLYKATNVTQTMPFDIDIDLRGVNMLTIKIGAANYESYVALTDLALYK